MMPLVPASSPSKRNETARAGNRRFRLLSALRAHTKAPYKTDLHRKTLMALNRPGTARTDVVELGVLRAVERRQVVQERGELH